MVTPDQYPQALIDNPVRMIADAMGVNDLTRQQMLRAARDATYPDDILERADDERSDQ